ncbi:MAG: hypothetical protein HZB50_02785 [Chloroflexi bacterium]|nr:hypothetical protein [Chloroflexota bacterium]
MTASLSIGILFEQRYITHSQPAGLIASLQACGHRVILLDPQSFPYEAGNHSWLSKFDLVIARGRSLGLQYFQAWAETQQPSMIVPSNHKTSRRINKLSCQVHDSCYTVIVNPVLSENRRGVHIVHSPDEMAGLRWTEVSPLAQQFLPDDSCNLKLYEIDGKIWIVRKRPHFHPQQFPFPIPDPG